MEEGLFMLQPFEGSERRLQLQQQLLKTLEGEGFPVDTIIPDREGNLIVKDEQENGYILRRWLEGRECDTRSERELLLAASRLGAMHCVMKLPLDQKDVQEPPELEFIRHNRELQKIRKFIRKKRPSHDFEREYLAHVEEYLQWGQEALLMLQQSKVCGLLQKSLEEGCVCHGEFNQHHLLFERPKIMVTGFDRWKFGLQVSDLYCFMRKILEKYNWDISLGKKLLSAYDRERKLSDEEHDYLKICFSYPEKYWKIADYYYSHNKAWISEKNVKKLRTVTAQKRQWRNFADSL